MLLVVSLSTPYVWFGVDRFCVLVTEIKDSWRYAGIPLLFMLYWQTAWTPAIKRPITHLLSSLYMKNLFYMAHALDVASATSVNFAARDILSQTTESYTGIGWYSINSVGFLRAHIFLILLYRKPSCWVTQNKHESQSFYYLR